MDLETIKEILRDADELEYCNDCIEKVFIRANGENLQDIVQVRDKYRCNKAVSFSDLYLCTKQRAINYWKKKQGE